MNSLHSWLVEWLKFLAIEFSLLFDNDKGGDRLLAQFKKKAKKITLLKKKDLAYRKKQKVQNLGNLQQNCSCHALY